MVPDCLKQTDCLGPLTLSVARGGCLAAVDTFAGYAVAVPVCSAHSSHDMVALETNLGHVFSFMGHLQTDMVCLFSQKAVHSGLTSRLFDNLPFSQPSTGMVFSCQKSLLSLPHHTPEQGSLVIDCGCSRKGIIYSGPPPGPDWNSNTIA